MHSENRSRTPGGASAVVTKDWTSSGAGRFGVAPSGGSFCGCVGLMLFQIKVLRAHEADATAE